MLKPPPIAPWIKKRLSGVDPRMLEAKRLAGVDPRMLEAKKSLGYLPPGVPAGSQEWWFERPPQIPAWYSQRGIQPPPPWVYYWWINYLNYLKTRQASQQTSPPAPAPTTAPSPYIGRIVGVVSTPKREPTPPQAGLQYIVYSTATQDKPPAPTSEEVQTFRALHLLTGGTPSSESAIEYAFKKNHGLDDFLALSWASSYLILAQKHGLFSGFPQLQAGVSSAISTVVSPLLALASGPVGFLASWIQSLGSMIAQALKWEAATEAEDRRQRAANQKILELIGPPPAMLDIYLVNWCAVWMGRRRTEIEEIILHQFILYKRFAFGVLGLMILLPEFGYSKDLNHPLDLERIRGIGNWWTLAGFPVNFLDQDYVLSVPGWAEERLHYVAKLPQIWKTRNTELKALIAYYQKGSGYWLSPYAAVAPLQPYSRSDQARFAALKAAIGLNR